VDRIRNKYNPEVSQLKAERTLDEVTKEQHKIWLQNPCTKSLRYTIESALDQLVLGWVKSDFTSNNFESIAINQSKSTGMSAALEEVLSYIEDMVDEPEEITL